LRFLSDLRAIQIDLDVAASGQCFHFVSSSAQKSSHSVSRALARFQYRCV
jgi:hypothetical protein